MMLLPWKLFFSMMIFSGTIISMSASSWLMAWIGLEINLLSFMAIAFSASTPRNSEAMMKYFLVQALASAIFIFSAFISYCTKNMNLFETFFVTVIILSLMIKLGAAPFHLWVPHISNGLSWANLNLILTWQKLAPIVILSMCFKASPLMNKILLLFIIVSAIVGAISGLTQNSVRKLLAFSSINHLAWMISSLMCGLSALMLYFLFYSSILISITSILKITNASSLSNVISFKKIISLTLIISLFSFGGLPPFSGFAPKWMIISMLANTNQMLVLILVLTSLVTLFFYMRICLHLYTFKQSTMKNKTKFNTYFVVMINLMGLPLSMLLI